MSNRTKFELLRTFTALAIAFILAFVIILFVSEDPILAIRTFIIGPIDSKRHIGNVLEMTIPLIFTGLGVSIIFSSNEFNIAASGVFVISAITAAAVAIFSPIGGIIGILLAMLLGSLVGMVFMIIPGVLKVKWGVSELVVSLMLNYVLYQLAGYILNYKLRDPAAGGLASYKFIESIELSGIVDGTRLHSGLYIAIIMALLAYLFLYKTKIGYEIRTVGANSNFAKYSGIKTGITVLIAQAVGGMIVGMGGAVEMLGMYSRYQWQTIPTFGFDGLMVAIIARNNPALIPIAAIFLAYVRIGADMMARYTDVQSELITIIQALVIMLLVAESFLSKLRYKNMVKSMNLEGVETNE